jgi:hypothetical protein
MLTHVTRRLPALPLGGPRLAHGGAAVRFFNGRDLADQRVRDAVGEQVVKCPGVRERLLARRDFEAHRSTYESADSREERGDNAPLADCAYLDVAMSRAGSVKSI